MRLLRSWTTLLLLAEGGGPATATEVLEQLRERYPFEGFELSLQTTRDDLKLLRLCGFPVVACDASGCEVDLDEPESLQGRLKNVRWALRSPSCIGDFAPADLPRPSTVDVLTLHLLRALLHQTRPVGPWLSRSLQRLLDELGRLYGPPKSIGRSRPLLCRSARFRAAGDASSIARRHLSARCRVTEEMAPGGVVFFDVTFNDSEELERVALGLVGIAVVVDPPELRSRIVKRLQAGLIAYGGEEAGDE